MTVETAKYRFNLFYARIHRNRDFSQAKFPQEFSIVLYAYMSMQRIQPF
jgi:hypothetical protein